MAYLLLTGPAQLLRHLKDHLSPDMAPAQTINRFKPDRADQQKTASLRRPVHRADTTSAAGRMILTIFAEFERALLRERTAERRRLARGRGIHMGCPAKLKPHEAETAHKLITEEQAAASDVALKYGVHRTPSTALWPQRSANLTLCTGCKQKRRGVSPTPFPHSEMRSSYRL